MSISITQGLIKTYKETHGMTKETEAFYYGHHEKMRQIERDHQNAINAIADPYLNNSSKSSTTSTRTNCSICSGTGVDPFPWEDGSTGHGQGIYTNQSGKKCPHCGRYTWHQHVRCPKCNAR